MVRRHRPQRSPSQKSRGNVPEGPIECAALFAPLDRRWYDSQPGPGASVCARQCCLECLDRWTAAGYSVAKVPFGFGLDPKPQKAEASRGPPEDSVTVAHKTERWHGPSVARELERLESAHANYPDDRTVLYALRLLREVTERSHADGSDLLLEVPYHQVGGIDAYSTGASMQSVPRTAAEGVPRVQRRGHENAHFAILCPLAERSPCRCRTRLSHAAQRQGAVGHSSVLWRGDGPAIRCQAADSAYSERRGGGRLGA